MRTSYWLLAYYTHSDVSFIMELARAIKLVRTASGIRQKEVARKLGVTANYISLIESGKREPSISFLKQLAKLLGVPIGFFFLWDERDTNQPRQTLDQVQGLLSKLEGMYVFSQRKKIRRRVAA